MGKQNKIKTFSLNETQVTQKQQYYILAAWLNVAEQYKLFVMPKYALSHLKFLISDIPIIPACW